MLGAAAVIGSSAFIHPPIHTRVRWFSSWFGSWTECRSECTIRHCPDTYCPRISPILYSSDPLCSFQAPSSDDRSAGSDPCAQLSGVDLNDSPAGASVAPLSFVHIHTSTSQTYLAQVLTVHLPKS